MRIRALIFIVLALIPTLGFGHTLWLNLSDYYPENGRTVAYFGWGHRYPVDGLLDQERLLESFRLMKPSGEIKDILPNPGGLGATEVELPEQGTHILCAKLKPGFYTMYRTEGEVHHKMGPKTALSDVLVSIYYEQYAKAIVNTGEGSESFSRPAGHRLEIVPLEDPAKLRGCGGHFLPVQVLFDGTPVMHCQVLATYSGFSTEGGFAYGTFTDAEGKARIRLIHWGPWIVWVNHQLPPTDELRDKCDQLSYTATLTLGVK